MKVTEFNYLQKERDLLNSQSSNVPEIIIWVFICFLILVFIIMIVIFICFYLKWKKNKRIKWIEESLELVDKQKISSFKLQLKTIDNLVKAKVVEQNVLKRLEDKFEDIKENRNSLADALINIQVDLGNKIFDKTYVKQITGRLKVYQEKIDNFIQEFNNASKHFLIVKKNLDKINRNLNVAFSLVEKEELKYGPIKEILLLLEKDIANQNNIIKNKINKNILDINKEIEDLKKLVKTFYTYVDSGVETYRHLNSIKDQIHDLKNEIAQKSEIYETLKKINLDYLIKEVEVIHNKASIMFRNLNIKMAQKEITLIYHKIQIIKNKINEEIKIKHFIKKETDRVKVIIEKIDKTFPAVMARIAEINKKPFFFKNLNVNEFHKLINDSYVVVKENTHILSSIVQTRDNNKAIFIAIKKLIFFAKEFNHNVDSLNKAIFSLKERRKNIFDLQVDLEVALLKIKSRMNDNRIVLTNEEEQNLVLLQKEMSEVKKMRLEEGLIIDAFDKKVYEIKSNLLNTYKMIGKKEMGANMVSKLFENLNKYRIDSEPLDAIMSKMQTLYFDGKYLDALKTLVDFLEKEHEGKNVYKNIS